MAREVLTRWGAGADAFPHIDVGLRGCDHTPVVVSGPASPELVEQQDGAGVTAAAMRDLVSAR